MENIIDINKFRGNANFTTDELLEGHIAIDLLFEPTDLGHDLKLPEEELEETLYSYDTDKNKLIKRNKELSELIKELHFENKELKEEIKTLNLTYVDNKDITAHKIVEQFHVFYGNHPIYMYNESITIELHIPKNVSMEGVIQYCNRDNYGFRNKYKEFSRYTIFSVYTQYGLENWNIKLVKNI